MYESLSSVYLNRTAGTYLWDALCWGGSPSGRAANHCVQPQATVWPQRMLHSSWAWQTGQVRCADGKLCLGCSGSFPSAPCWLLHLHRGESATRELLQEIRNSQCGSFPLCWEGTALCRGGLQQRTLMGAAGAFGSRKRAYKGHVLLCAAAPHGGRERLQWGQRVSGIKKGWKLLRCFSGVPI